MLRFNYVGKYYEGVLYMENDYGIVEIYATNYTHTFVDHNVLREMSDDIPEDKPTILIFDGVTVLSRDLETLAYIIVEANEQVAVMGLPERSESLLASHISRIIVPEFTDIQGFAEMFLAKFPVGTLCVWDLSLKAKKELNNRNLVSLVMIEGIKNNYLHFRLYRSHMVEPYYVNKYGGLDAPELYTRDTIHLTELMEKEETIRYAKEGMEEEIIEFLKSLSK